VGYIVSDNQSDVGRYWRSSSAVYTIQFIRCNSSLQADEYEKILIPFRVEIFDAKSNQ